MRHVKEKHTRNGHRDKVFVAIFRDLIPFVRPIALGDLNFSGIIIIIS